MQETKFKAKNFGAVMAYIDNGLNATAKKEKSNSNREKKKECKKCKGTGFYFDEKGSAVRCGH